ncbi:DUF1249 domain-containing protein [Thioalkalivibrio sp. ALM2T]|uniref:DUF1249 domain-containing protein n=1 Tax=Thioalkalivibrio sp. ALM2T TaxID=1158184 RepID=UPI00039BACE8|nr:DUF1249 domain-containing protein [Thioalkalivibrio sp. ALM2T]
MLLERKTPSHLEPRPESFAALMEMYEENYLALRRLCPELERQPLRSVSRVEGALDLYLEVLERTRYTTTLHLTYQFDHQGERRQQPDMRVRMFHDARQAEVLELHCRTMGDGRAPEMLTGHPGLVCRWRHNRFLYKWLRYCLRQGHRFLADAAPEVVAADS